MVSVASKVLTSKILDTKSSIIHHTHEKINDIGKINGVLDVQCFMNEPTVLLTFFSFNIVIIRMVIFWLRFS